MIAYDEIIDSYINGQFKQMKRQMDKIIMSDFLEYMDKEYSRMETIKMMIIYFRLKENKK